MKLAQVVRDRFNEITEWRSQGEPWAEIDGHIRAMGQSPGTNSVRTLYRLELARRSSPEREAALRWANSNYRATKDLLDQGHDWTAILILLPPNFNVDPGSSGLTRLVAEFKSIDRLHSSSDEVPSTATQKTPLPEMRTELVAEGTDIAESSSPVPLSDQVSKSVSDRLDATAVEKEKQKLTPRVDPFVSGPKLHDQVTKAGERKAEMHQNERAVPGDEREQWKKLRNEADAEHDQMKVDFLYRFSDYRAIYSKLHILASSALACGAYVVADAESDDTIMLQGYDRPDEIKGLDEVPEPLFIRENLGVEELTKIQESYVADDLEVNERTPARRLAEALIMRGEFLTRRGWHEYVTLVKLEGEDFPSPTLSAANKWEIRSKSMDIWPKLTGDEPVQAPEYERKRVSYKPDSELVKRGEWT